MIKIWYCNYQGFEEGHFNDLLKVLPASLNRDVLKYTYFSDRAARLIARLLIRKAIIETGFTENLILQWTKDLHNKPFINKWMPFNISHSKDMVTIAFGGRSGLGIDIEHIEKSLDINPLLPHFHPAERKMLLNNATNDQFYHLWAKKEALLKGIGTGIIHGLDQFDCSESDTISYNNVNWKLQEIITEKEYVSYVAFQNDEDGPETKEINWQVFLQAQ